ncbi:hypothetical protein SAMN05216553_1317 [Lentzea fradiae]|uniref:ParB-like nuclease domain-containing protein n=1 Tax=Lentzea fradiae TaxID=200378 RepID=A0A1G8DL99_9PSEU|nr:hypothetical protein [Lentzea fradiae]SDH58432.1 hypothetical protein SAMN05216553_1317 [Lentzea fradiae]
MELHDFRVTDLVLDKQNPRFASQTSSDRESVNVLLAEAPAKLVALAQDIAREGVNPTELPVVVEIDGQNVVIEGNRRVAALKLLNNPDLANDERLRRQFREAAKSRLFPGKVKCAVASSRASAHHWLRLRHTGENGGVGVVPWNAEQQNKFLRRRGSQADRAIMLCDAITKRFSHAPDLLSKVEKVRKDRLTTLGRLAVDPEVRSAIGFDFNGDDVEFNYPDEFLIRAFDKLFSDLAGELSVSVVKNKLQRQKYIGEIESELPPRSKRLDKPVRAERTPAERPQPAASEEKTSPASIGSTLPRRREPQERCIFQGVRLKSFHLRTSDVLREAQKIDIDSSPNIAAIMLRVLVDVAVTDAASILGWTKSQNDLKDRIGAVLRKLDPQNSDPELHDARRHSEGAGLLGIRSLHGFVHHWATHPTSTDIRKISLAFRPMLEKLDVYLAENRKS